MTPVRRAAVRMPTPSQRAASGNIGVKEIERLIQKLEIDKEILADQEGHENEEAAN
ncbi:hypothetical protein ACE10X_22785 [Bradyrhizobium sp. Pha-3]|uniref:hypothetical protein n=1 Tax=Bradyrhizobium sp. Pha-3 TaxID=208375 RepID=UPI0035D3FB57